MELLYFISISKPGRSTLVKVTSHRAVTHFPSEQSSHPLYLEITSLSSSNKVILGRNSSQWKYSRMWYSRLLALSYVINTFIVAAYKENMNRVNLNLKVKKSKQNTKSIWNTYFQQQQFTKEMKGEAYLPNKMYFQVLYILRSNLLRKIIVTVNPKVKWKLYYFLRP